MIFFTSKVIRFFILNKENNTGCNVMFIFLNTENT